MSARAARAWATAAAAAVLLRLIGMAWGWPATFNADEPHIASLALSFGGGSLSPYLFKYPTLWPYLLFIIYGVAFIFWSGFGLLRAVPDFIALYAWSPGYFFVLGRLAAAACSLAAVEVLRRTEDSLGRRVPWGALLLAFSPVAVELAHSCKPDCLMLLFACLTWRAALRLLDAGDRASHWGCGAWAGLALSTQYTALPLALLLPAAHLLRRPRPHPRWLLEGAGCAAAAFLVGTPYALLDLPRFLDGARDMAALNRMSSFDPLAMAVSAVSNLFTLGLRGPLFAAAAAAGIWRMASRDPRRALLLGAAPAAYVCILSHNADGGWARYALGAFPAMLLFASEALDWQGRWRPAARILGIALIAQSLAASAVSDWRMLLPDTRAEAAAWVEANVPAGSTLLLDGPHEAPWLRMSREQALDLWERTRALGSPRAALYRAMADAHPGGGYRLIRFLRGPLDLRDYPGHVELSLRDKDVLDVRPGLRAALEAGAGYVVTSSFGLTPERVPESAAFFRELGGRGRLLREFLPARGAKEGPEIRIYSIQ